VVRHTDTDHQFEVLEKLAERSLIALVAIAFSITGYVMQEARNSSRQDAEMEETKTRVTNLGRIAATNTEARVRSEVELRELRQGQEEIKQMLLRHDSRSSRLLPER